MSLASELIGCCINVDMSLTDYVMSGGGILFFIMPNCNVAEASQSVIR